MHTRIKRHPVPLHILTAIFIVAATAILIWRVAIFAEQRELNQIRKTGQLRLSLYSTALRDTLSKYRNLPYILARDSRIRSLLKGESHPISVNPHLEDFAHTSDALIFVLDSEGETVASSNWRTDSSLIGTNFSFRPYFQDARQGDSGGYFAFGIKTRKPGYFISYPVLEMGTLLGVVVVKVDLERLQNSWGESEESIIVSDAYGVIFLSSTSQWRYKSLRPLPEATATALRQSKYRAQPLADLQVIRMLADGGNILEVPGEPLYFEQFQQLPELGWRLHYLTDLTSMQRTVKLATAGATLAAAALFSILLYLRERKNALLSIQAAHEADAVRDLNRRLTREVEQHKQTEQTLRQTQKELIKTGRLAAMGQMSAAIVHELNQPVTATRTFLASAKVLIDRNQPEKVHETLNYIEQLTDRMASITSQLKIFARETRGRKDPVDLSTLIERTLGFFELQLKQQGIELTVELVQKGEAIVSGDARKIEQVLNNLIQNAMDAVKSIPDGKLTVRLTTGTSEAFIECADNGPGIDDKIIDFLFDPFFSTKETGEGLGLGLAISYGIVQDMNGSITAENGRNGGASFIVTLPLEHFFSNNTTSPDR